MEIIHRTHRLIAVGENHIAFKDAGRLRRAALFNGDDQHAVFAGKVIKLHQPAAQWNVLTAHTEVASMDATVAKKTPGYELCSVAGDCEADTLRRKNHRRVHS